MNLGFLGKITGFDAIFCLLVGLMPLVAVVAPRFFAFYPLFCSLVLAVPFLRQRRAMIVDRALTLYLGIILALGTVSLIWSINPADSLNRLANLGGIFVSGILLSSLVMSSANLPDPKKVAGLFLIMTILAALMIGLDNLAGRPFMVFLKQKEISDIVSAAYNRGAVSVSLFAVICLFFCGQYQWYKRAGLLAVAVLLMALSVESQSCHLILATGLIAYGLFPYREPWAWRGVLAALVILCLSTPALIPYVHTHWQSALGANEWLRQSFAMLRVEIWHELVNHVHAQPLWGYGIEAAKSLPLDPAALSVNIRKVLHPHNVILQFWVEFGLLGIVVLCACLTRFFEHMTKIARTAAAGRFYMTLFIPVFAVSCVAYGFWQSWWIGLLLMLVIMGRYVTKQSGEHAA